MKNYFLILLTIILAFPGHTQTTFTKLISGEDDQEVKDLIECINGDYLLIGTNANESNKNGYAFILGPSGELKHELILNNPDEYTYFFSVHQVLENYVIIGSTINSINNDNDICFWVLDSALNIIDFNSSEVPEGKWISYLKSIIDTDGNFSIVGYTNQNYPDNFNPFVYKLSNAGDSLFSRFENTATEWDRYFDIIENQDSSYYYIFGSYLSAWGELGKKYIMTKSFDSVTVQDVPIGLHDFYSPTYINDSNMLISGNAGVDYEGELLAMTINDKTELIDFNHFSKQGSSKDQACMFNGVSINDSNIYTGGTSNFCEISPFYGFTDSWYHLIKLNTDLQVIWEYWYGGDTYYFLYGILATSDGGCIMAGQRYDDVVQNAERDIYIVKVNSDGLVTWTSQIPILNTRIYPNPGNEQIFIESNEPTQFQLFNSSGAKIMWKQLTEGKNLIGTDKLPSGIYFYTIKDYKQKHSSGKWIKL